MDKNQGNNIGHPILNGVVKPELKEAIVAIVTACRKAGKKCGVYASTGEQAKQFADQGFDMISVATDYTSLDALLKEQLSIARGLTKPAKVVSY